jgi:hypothetical protein
MPYIPPTGMKTGSRSSTKESDSAEVGVESVIEGVSNISMTGSESAVSPHSHSDSDTPQHDSRPQQEQPGGSAGVQVDGQQGDDPERRDSTASTLTSHSLPSLTSSTDVASASSQSITSLVSASDETIGEGEGGEGVESPVTSYDVEEGEGGRRDESLIRYKSGMVAYTVSLIQEETGRSC